ncbi:MAG TPA: hypothetical protein VHN82_04840 [Methanoregula sp.]|nr:hypothetical protein [Methanoregula sp.]
MQKTGKPAVKKEIPVIDTAEDIIDSVRLLTEKYSLTQFTLATSDGLVLASGGVGSALEDAAWFGRPRGEVSEENIPGIAVFTVTHKGSDLTGIIRSNLPIPQKTLVMIECDTQDILTRWI